MSVQPHVGFRLLGLLVPLVAAATFFGCPPPEAETAPVEQGISQHVLDSLRADSARRCRMHRSYAYNYARSDLREDAIRQFRKALTYCSDDPDVERYYARYLDEWGMHDSAVVHYIEAGRLDTVNVRVHFWLYEYYYDQGNYQNAIRELLCAARNNTEQEQKIRWLKNAADMMVSEGMQDRACALYSELQALCPADPDLAQRMLTCVGDNPEERLSALRTACEADSTNQQVCQLYAQEAERSGEDRAALDVYLSFAQRDTENISNWESVLRVSKRLGEASTVFDALEQLNRLEPDNPERTAALIDEYFAQDRLSEGSNVLLPKLNDYPNNAHLLYLAGIYYTRRGGDSNTRRGLEYLCRAIRTNDPIWRSQALHMYDGIVPRLSEEEINQARFFGRKVQRPHICDIPERARERDVVELSN